MDANGLRFWSLADEADWALPSSRALRYDRERRTLRLASFREVELEEPAVDPEARVDAVPHSVDAFGTYAFYDAATESVAAAGAAPGQVVLGTFTGRPVSDLALGHDGVLYVCNAGALTWIDPRGRWTEATRSDPALTAFRLAARLDGGMFVLDREHRQIWIAEGQPLPTAAGRRFHGDVFRPDPENADPPRLRLLATLAADEDPVALASNREGHVVVLCWLPSRQACVRRVARDGRLGPRVLLAGVERPFSVRWLDTSTVLVLVETTTSIEPLPYDVPEGDAALTAPPLGGVYPLVDYSGGPLAHSSREPARYPVQRAASPFPDAPRPLVRLSAPELARGAEASSAHPLDSRQTGTVWHRAYLEAVVPEHCGVRLWLAATETSAAPAASEFFLHVLGDVSADAGVPRAIWSTQPSELPFHPGLCPCPIEPHRVGLFGVLVQRSGRIVRALSGRYLHVRVELVGNGRATPELVALRVYGSRFSYVDQYLPRLYREQLFGPDADAASEQSTPADFLERFLSTFESMLTPLEDRIASAHLLTDPASAPEEALAWLGEWVGLVFDPAYPPEHRRRALHHAMTLNRWHGTLRGLTLALDILTGDALGRGEIVVVEDYRLRRTFATILGADLADEADPLTAGIVDSGNSVVGDTLILGSEFRREFLAVFREVLPERPSGASLDEWVSFIYQRLIDPVLVDAFFDRFAHRLTVLVQRETTEDRVRLIERIVELEAPAHLQTQVVRASHPFIVGLASLVGVDTFLREPEPPPVARADESRLGTTFLLRPASLDPRLEVGA